MTAAEAHPPTHLLADLAEGVLDDAQAREVRAHVDQCLTCQATLDELARVTVALRGLPAELPVPEFVAARISHALAAERASGAGPAAAAADEGDGDGGTVAWFRRRLPQGIAAAASVAVLGLAGYVAVGGGNGGGGDDTSAADAAAAGAGEEADSGGPAFSGPSSTSRLITPSETTEEAPPPSTPSIVRDPVVPTSIEPARLIAAVEEVVEGRAEPVNNDTCGDDLSDELGLPVLGTTWVGSGVLVVLEDATTYDGWLLSTCASNSNETLEPQVEVPKSE